MSKSKQSSCASPQPKTVILRQIRHLTKEDLAGRSTTAVGLPDLIGATLYEVYDSVDALRAALAPPPAPPPKEQRPVYKTCESVLRPNQWARPNPQAMASIGDQP